MPVKRSPIQAKAPFFDEIDRLDFVALPEKVFISCKRSSLKPCLVEWKHPSPRHGRPGASRGGNNGKRCLRAVSLALFEVPPRLCHRIRDMRKTDDTMAGHGTERVQGCCFHLDGERAEIARARNCGRGFAVGASVVHVAPR